MFSKAAGVLSVAICLAAALGFGDEAKSNSATPTYRLEPGTRLEFVTSGTFTNLREGGEESVRHHATYTVLDRKKDVLDVFMAIDRLEPAPQEKFAKVGPRDSFQITDKGEIRKRGPLAPQQLFPGWSLNAELIRIFEPTPDGKLNYTDPTSGLELPVKVETRTENGIYHQKLTYDGKEEQNKDLPFQIRSVVVEADFSTTEGAPLGLRQDFQAELADPTSGENKQIRARLEVRRVASGKLSEQELATLRDDAAAGASAARAMRESLSANELDTTKVLSVLDEYLQKFPNGEFAGMFKTMVTEVRSATERMRNWQAATVGKRAVPFEATDINGKVVRLADMAGKVVLLDFWATWCGPCRAIMPEMKKLYEENKDKDFVMVGVSADQSLEDLKEYIEKEGIEWTQIFEPEASSGTLQYRYGVSKYPTTFLIDKKGTIQAVDAHPEQIREAIKRLLEDK